MKPILYLLLIMSLCSGCQKISKANQYTMQPYFNIDDWVLIDKTSRSSYDYGDVVMCKFENEEDVFALRVVGLPGDSLAMEDYTCIINDKKNPRRQIADSVAFYDWGSLGHANEVCEEFPNGKKVNLYIEKEVKVNKEFEERTGTTIYVPEASFSSVSIPSGHYYVLADTRAWATDSRLYGPIAKKNIKGRITKVFPAKDSKK